MDADELAEVDQQLRETCAQHGLGWVVAQVDELIAQGHDVFDTDEPYYQGRRAHSDRYPMVAYGRRPQQAGLRSVPFTPAERTLLLIDAMITVFTQLPAAQASAVGTLRQGFEGRAPVVDFITSIDADDESATIDLTDIPDADYQPVVASLLGLREEVTAQERPGPAERGTEDR